MKNQDEDNITRMAISRDYISERERECANAFNHFDSTGGTIRAYQLLHMNQF